MGLWIRAGDMDFGMTYADFKELRRDLARLISLEAAIDGDVAWPTVDMRPEFIPTGGRRLGDLILPEGRLGNPPELEQQPLLALVFLLDHPYNEGYLPSHQCEWLAPALDQVIAQWADDSDKRAWIRPLSDLRDCCQFAADNHVALEFT